MNGGVCCATFVPYFVNPEVDAWLAEAEEAGAESGVDQDDFEAGLAFFDRWRAANPGPQATVADVADHVDHLREVAGLDHVGLGGDYDGCAFFPVGLQDVTGYPRLLDELRTRRWSEPELARLTHRNVLRVLGDN